MGLFLSKKYPFEFEISYTGMQLRSSDQQIFLAKFNKFHKDSKVGNFIKAHEKQYIEITKFAEKSIVDSKVLNDVARFYNKPSDGKF